MTALKTTPELHHRWWGAAYALTKLQWQQCHCAARPKDVGDRCDVCKEAGDELDAAEQALRDAGEWNAWGQA